MTRPRVTVVGGGLAGLAAAIRCADAGAAVTLLEQRRRLGGATWSRPHRSLGFEIDNGQHLFMRGFEQYLDFLTRLGVRDRVALQPRLAVPVARPGQPLAWIRRHALPAPAHLAPSLLGFAALPPLARLRAGRSALALASLDPDDAALDDRSLGAWLAERGAGSPHVEAFFDLLIRPTLNTRAAEASLALAARVFRTGFGERCDFADLGWSRVPLDALHAEPARRALRSAGAEVCLDAKVERLERLPDGRVVATTRERAFAADAVVVAAPPREASALLGASDLVDARWLVGVASLAHSPIVNLHVVFDRRVLALPFVAGFGTPLQWIFDRSASAGLDEGQYLTVSLSAGDAYLGLSSEALRGIFLPAFHALLPASRAARVLRFAVTVERTATLRQVAGTRRLRPAPGALARGVYLAGAWTDTGWPATMEAAVRSGRTAADAALRDLARVRPGTPRIAA